MEIKHLKTKDIKPLRDKLLKLNEGKCPILLTELDPKQAVLDHIHKQRKSDNITENAGVVRNTIDRNVNCMIGKIENAYKRYIPRDTNDLPSLLRNIADYIEKGPYNENGVIFSHPTENGNGDLIKMKNIPFQKRLFNKLNLKLKENKKKTINYKKYLDSRIYQLLKEYCIEDLEGLL